MNAANKVVLNTAILYGRMLLTMGISLYTTRLVLNALGSEDFGVFQLLAGVIAMLSFFKEAMATSTQRFLSFFQGKKDLKMQKTIFTNSLVLHLLIGLLILVTLLLLENILFDGLLNIPNNKVEPARLIFYFMSASVFFTILTVPFTGVLIAHENMIWVALVNIIEVVLKLIIAIILLKIDSNKLIVYGLLMALISVFSLLAYSIFCISKYEECTLKGITKINILEIKKLSSFAGWNLFGSLCGLGRIQGIAIILNLFFGTVVNAAYGIANQLSSQLNFFSVTMLRALNPQIMKSEGAGNRDRMIRLSMIASKFGFFLLAIFAIPSIFEMPYILKYWLKDVPENTVIFCSLILISTLFNQLTIGIQSAFQASGKIKLYQVVVGTLILLNLPVAYFLLKIGLPAYSVLISYAIIEFLACIFRLLIAKKIIGLSVKIYLQRVIYKKITPLLVIIFTCYLITYYFNFQYRFLLTGAISSILFLFSVYFFGLTEDEKVMINQLNKKVLTKLKIMKQ